MMDYPSNSHKSKLAAQKAQEEKKLEKVISGTAKVRKKSELSKLKDTFISEDASKVKSYIFVDVLIPAIKKAVSDIVTNGIDMILYGEAGRSKKNSAASKVSYRSYYDRDRDDRRQSPAPRVGYSYDDVVVDTYGEAESVIDRMNEVIEMYGMVSVADFYELVDVKGNYTDNRYGWTNLRSAEPVRVKDGYVIRLPRAVPLN